MLWSLRKPHWNLESSFFRLRDKEGHISSKQDREIKKEGEGNRKRRKGKEKNKSHSAYHVMATCSEMTETQLQSNNREHLICLRHTL